MRQIAFTASSRFTSIFVMWILGVSCAAAQEAMILYSDGDVVPAPKQYEKVAIPTEFTLGDTGLLEIAHLGTCQTIDARGPGKVILDHDKLQFSGQGSSELKSGKCAVRLKLKDNGRVTAGVNLRSFNIEGRQEVTSRPMIHVDFAEELPDLSLVFTGIEPEKSRFRIPVTARFLVWPRDGKMLTQGARYSVQIFSEGEPISEPLELSIAVPDAAAAEYIVFEQR